MMSMAGGLPGTVPVPPPTTDSKTGSIGSNRSVNILFSVKNCFKINMLSILSTP